MPDTRPVMRQPLSSTAAWRQVCFTSFTTGISVARRRFRAVSRSEEYFPHLANGRWLYSTATPLLNDQGECIGAIETLQDVTERRVAKERLLAHQNQLEQMVSERTSQLAKANTELEVERKALEELLARVEETQQQLLQSEKMAAIGQLAAGVAHEINNPVGFVNSNLGTLKTYIGQLFGVIEAYRRRRLPAAIRASHGHRQKADFDFLREDLPSLLRRVAGGPGPGHQDRPGPEGFLAGGSGRIPVGRPQHRLESTLNVVWNEVKYKAEVIRELGDIPEVECVAGTDQPGVDEPAGQRSHQAIEHVAASRFAPGSTMAISGSSWPILARA